MKKRKFGYNCMPDVISDLGYAALAVLLLGVALIVLFEGAPKEVVTIVKIVYIAIVSVAILFCIIPNCIKTKCNYLIIYEDRIEYNSGWLFKSTTIITAKKIRSCKKSSGLLQRAFGVGNIIVTTAGDSAEISSDNVIACDEAYLLIVKMYQTA